MQIPTTSAHTRIALDEYVRAIRHKEKAKYARAYRDWLLGWGERPENPDRRLLGYMGAQAVRLCMDEIFMADPNHPQHTAGGKRRSPARVSEAARRRQHDAERSSLIAALGWQPENPAEGYAGRYVATNRELREEVRELKQRSGGKRRHATPGASVLRARRIRRLARGM